MDHNNRIGPRRRLKQFVNKNLVLTVLVVLAIAFFTYYSRFKPDGITSMDEGTTLSPITNNRIEMGELIAVRLPSPVIKSTENLGKSSDHHSCVSEYQVSITFIFGSENYIIRLFECCAQSCPKPKLGFINVHLIPRKKKDCLLDYLNLINYHGNKPLVKTLTMMLVGGKHLKSITMEVDTT